MAVAFWNVGNKGRCGMSGIKRYVVDGVRQNGKLNIFLNGELIDPRRSQGIVNHSPDGFNAGYLGSGPAQSALGILVEITDRNEALHYYQAFKSKFLSNKLYLNARKFTFEFEWPMERL